MKSPFSFFIVSEDSMLPTFKPGDHALTFNWVKPKAGDVVVFTNSKITYIKRIVKINGQKIYVRGDNIEKSRLMGPIKKLAIVGNVIYRY